MKISKSFERVNLIGVPVDNVSMEESVSFAKKTINQGGQATIIAVNPEKVIAARCDPFLLKTIEASELLIPDGIGAVLAARLQGAQIKSRVAGAELMPQLCAMAEEENFSVFLFGASELVNSQVVKVLKNLYPNIHIAGRKNGYISNTEYHDLVALINESEAKILFVALGSPRQERFISAYRDQLKVNIIQGVGGTFDVLTENVKRAPLWCRKLNLEWLYRLVSQPMRLFRQTALPKFVYLVLRNFFSCKSRQA